MEKVALTLLTGFLGAGKTTLVNRLLKDPALADTAVIVNEFGEVGIDHLLVEQSADGIIELSDGCLCCTVRGALVDTLVDLGERMEAGKVGPLKRVIVETTGLADPVPVLHALIAHPALAALFRLDGVITVVDAVNGLVALDEHEEARRQVAVADRIVMTKSDLATDEAVARLAGRLQAENPTATLVDAGAGEAGPTALLNCGTFDDGAGPVDVRRRLREGAHAGDGHDHHHHGDGHHHHKHNAIQSLVLRHDRPLPRMAIENFLDLLRSQCGEQLLRIKGIVETVEDATLPLVVHGVRQLLHPPERLGAWPEGPRGTRLVLIGSGLDEAYVRTLFSAFVGEIGVDTPDRAALEENPLAITGFKG